MQTILNSVVQYSRLIYQTLGNRRGDDRHSISGVVNASWKSRYGEVLTYACNGLNLSASGVAVASPEPVSVSSDAYLDSSEHHLNAFAVVRYCRKLAAGYQIGLEFRSMPKT